MASVARLLAAFGLPGLPGANGLPRVLAAYLRALLMLPSDCLACLPSRLAMGPKRPGMQHYNTLGARSLQHG